MTHVVHCVFMKLEADEKQLAELTAAVSNLKRTIPNIEEISFGPNFTGTLAIAIAIRWRVVLKWRC